MLSGVLSLLSQLTPGPRPSRPPRAAPHVCDTTMISSPDLRGHTVLVLHAHPDDEAIFTGITLRRLADAGARTVLVVATAGELGGSRVPLRPRRDRPASAGSPSWSAPPSCSGCPALVLLGRRDSGLPGWADGRARRGALAAADPAAAWPGTVAELADDEGAGAIVHDDEHGIYGHPDHRATCPDRRHRRRPGRASPATG